MIKRYLDYIKEADEIAKKDLSVFDDIKNDVKEKIESTVKKSGGEYASFIEKMIKDPGSVQIEGLINDDQIYDFWIKYKNDIDEILNNIKFFDKSPKDLNIVGVYKYVIACTQKAIEEVVVILSEDISSESK